jgi:hypothetical protein
VLYFTETLVYFVNYNKNKSRYKINCPKFDDNVFRLVDPDWPESGSSILAQAVSKQKRIYCICYWQVLNIDIKSLKGKNSNVSFYDIPVCCIRKVEATQFFSIIKFYILQIKLPIFFILLLLDLAPQSWLYWRYTVPVHILNFVFFILGMFWCFCWKKNFLQISEAYRFLELRRHL